MQEKISFTEQIRIALSKPLWYKSLFRQSIGKHICYFLILIVLITVIRFVIPVAAYLQSVGGLERLILEGIPTFSLSGGELTVDEVIDVEKNGVRLVIDTSADAFTVEEAQEKATEMKDTLPVVYMVSRTNMVCNQTTVPLNMADFGAFSFDNQALYQIAPVYLVIYGILCFAYNIIAYLISALFFAFFGYLMNQALKLNLKFGQIYLIALYAKSVEIILESILEVVGFSLLYYIGSVIGIFITCNYMTRGMSSMLIPSASNTNGDNESKKPPFML
ncbi:MAG: DUF1189 family protein [Lachnospiraceae bacterium]|nr:DUF1189 family protein [Lachnospiraceae bacterium]MBP3506138.1 DUF1189 family protein [Lachnospiraceae bacterium]